MKTVCFNCHTIIRPGLEDGPDSSGLCMECLIEALKPLYRKQQKSQGYSECFGTASGYCDQADCRYSRICVHKTI
ncbi:MAG: hypothetical protein CVU64_24885 [Deltaproteobacteria bacterium HGW-Deltaproteobacteria-21]|nr:MAG: hypothetical protein CVU64_24885 [Deltaproteobacteria bacterium HGW-Deltaproteobacteria-21]